MLLTVVYALLFWNQLNYVEYGFKNCNDKTIIDKIDQKDVKLIVSMILDMKMYSFKRTN